MFVNKKYSCLIAKIVLTLFLLTVFLPIMPAFWEGYDPARAMAEEAVTVTDAVYSELALKAVRNNFATHQRGTLVDGNWGNFSAYDAYILKQAGVDLTTWVYNGISFQDSVLGLIEETIAKEATENKSSAKRVAHEYLAAQALGEEGKAGQLIDILKLRQQASGNGSFANNPFDDLPAFEALGRGGAINELNQEDAITYILAQQDKSGAWGSVWGDVFYSDFMTTAQGIRALIYLKNETLIGSEINTAITKGLDWLKGLQKDDGSFQNGEWDDPLTDTVEVINILVLRGIDLHTWVSAAGNSPVDYIVNDALNEDGTFGGLKNIGDNTWALDAYLALGGNPSPEEILGLTVSPAKVEIAVGENKEFNVKSYQISGETQDINKELVNWSSDNDSIATIASSGVVKGVAVGETVIKALYSGVSSSIQVKVTGSSGGGTSPEQTGTEINIKVIGKNGENLYSGNVRLKADDRYGITVLGALDKTELSYGYQSELVNAIAGQKNQGMNGWMYKVNGTIPTSSVSSYKLSSGDKVVWFYSTSSDNLAGLGGSQISAIKFPGKTVDEIIEEQIKKESEIVISLDEREQPFITLKKETIDKIMENNKPLVIKNAGAEIRFGQQCLLTEEITKALANDNAEIKIEIREIDSNQARVVLEEIVSKPGRKLIDIGGKIFEFSFQIVLKNSDDSITEQNITEFAGFLPVKIDLSQINVNGKQANLTGIRFELDEEGNYVPVKLGGTYDSHGKTFTFYTNSLSLYGVMEAEELLKISLGINKPFTIINGVEGWTEVPPTIFNNRTMVPIRLIAEALGAQVEWLEEINTVTIKLGAKTISFTIGELLTGMDTPAMMLNYRTMVPLRYISENLGARVMWFDETQKIEIIK